MKSRFYSGYIASSQVEARRGMVIFKLGLLLWAIGCAIEIIFHHHPVFLVGALSIHFFSTIAGVLLCNLNWDNEGGVLLMLNILLTPVIFLAACMWLHL